MWQGLVCSNVWFKNTETHHPIWVRPDAGVGGMGSIRTTARAERTCQPLQTRYPAISNLREELLEARNDQRPAMLESIAKALTRRLLQDKPGIGIHEVSGRVAGFIKAVQWRVSPHSQAGGTA
jgi:hypothetical protein